MPQNPFSYILLAIGKHSPTPFLHTKHFLYIFVRLECPPFFCYTGPTYTRTILATRRNHPSFLNGFSLSYNYIELYTYMYIFYFTSTNF